MSREGFTEPQPLLPENWRLAEREAFLADMRQAVQGTPYPGYPAQADRLHIPADQLQYDNGRPIFPADPHAPYTVFDHSVAADVPRPASAFHDTGGPLPLEEARRINWGGLSTDARGLPLHPYAVEMVTDPSIGGIVGPGYFYHPGLTRTVDLGVLALGSPAEEQPNNSEVTLASSVLPDQVAMDGLRLCVLTVRRTDTEQYALPGGEIDPGEDALSAALREAREETGLTFATAESQGARLVADPRLTTCTAVETELFTIDAGTMPTHTPTGDENEVLAAEWVVADSKLLAPGTMFGSHHRMLMECVEWYQAQHNVTVMEDGSVAAQR